jgi:hypothetical protein
MKRHLKMEFVTDELLRLIQPTGTEHVLFRWKSPLALRPTRKECIYEMVNRFYKFILLLNLPDPMVYLKMAIVFLKRYPKEYLIEINIVRLFGCAVLIALKVLEDGECIMNHVWATKLLIVPTVRLNGMEMEFFKQLNWNIFISEDDFHNWKK